MAWTFRAPAVSRKAAVVAAGDGHARSAGREGLGDGASDAAAAARDQCHRVLQVHFASEGIQPADDCTPGGLVEMNPTLRRGGWGTRRASSE